MQAGGMGDQSQSRDAISLSHIVHVCLSQIAGAMSN